MSAIPYALSVHHFINSVGADAGFAAIVGLALVVLLFFAHARETRNLRDRAESAEEALHRLELYVDQIARSSAPATRPPAPAPAVPGAVRRLDSVTPAPASAAPAVVAAPAAAATAAPIAARTVTPVGAPAGALASVPAGAPAAPAGVGAPALSAATRLIPAGDEAAIAIHAQRATDGAVAEPVAAGLTTAAVMDPPAPAPSTAAGGANGGGSVRFPPPDSVIRDRPAGRTAPPPRPPGPRTAGVGATAARRGQDGREGGSRFGRGLIVLVTIVVIAAIVVGLFLLTRSGGGSTKTGTSTSQTTSARTRRSRGGKSTVATVSPKLVTVAVLNGTSTNLLAADIYAKLAPVGFKKGKIANAVNQTQTSTVVGYLPGYRVDALAVAKSLKLAPSSVQPVSAGNRGIACNGSSPTCSAQVVVTVGSDLASAA